MGKYNFKLYLKNLILHNELGKSVNYLVMIRHTSIADINVTVALLVMLLIKICAVIDLRLFLSYYSDLRFISTVAFWDSLTKLSLVAIEPNSNSAKGDFAMCSFRGHID